MRTILVGLAAILLIGCSNPNVTSDDFTQMTDAIRDASSQNIGGVPSEYKDLPKEMVAMMKDQGVLDKFLARARLHGQNPGLAIRFRQEQSVIVNLEGTDLQAELELDGGGTQLAAGTARALVGTLVELADRTDEASVKLRAEIIELLGWSRTHGNPPTSPDMPSNP
jgi:hypothetical protein